MAGAVAPLGLVPFIAKPPFPPFIDNPIATPLPARLAPGAVLRATAAVFWATPDFAREVPVFSAALAGAARNFSIWFIPKTIAELAPVATCR